MGSKVIEQIEAALRRAWARETAYPGVQNEWSVKNPAWGQCAVTALLIQEMFGGELLENEEHNHIWNTLPDGSQHDFSREQFQTDTDLSTYKVRTRESTLESPGALKAKTAERLAHLRQRFEGIGSIGGN